MKAFLRNYAGAVFALLTIFSLFFAFGRYISLYEKGENIPFGMLAVVFYNPDMYVSGFNLLQVTGYSVFETALLLSVIFCGLILIGTILKFVKRTPLKDKITDVSVIVLSLLLISSVITVFVFRSMGQYKPVGLFGGTAGVKLGGGAYMYLIFAVLCFLASLIGCIVNRLNYKPCINTAGLGD